MYPVTTAAETSVCCCAHGPVGPQEAMPFFLLLGYSFWVPQILHGAHRDTTDGLSNVYVLATTATRLFMPLYEASRMTYHLVLCVV